MNTLEAAQTLRDELSPEVIDALRHLAKHPSSLDYLFDWDSDSNTEDTTEE